MCYRLKSIPELDTRNVTDMFCMFYWCYDLESIPNLDTRNVINMSSMFDECRALKSIPELNTSKVTDMSDMFYRCYSLTSIPKLDTRNVTKMDQMFTQSSIKSIPKLDISKVKSAEFILMDTPLQDWDHEWPEIHGMPHEDHWTDDWYLSRIGKGYFDKGSSNKFSKYEFNKRGKNMSRSIRDYEQPIRVYVDTISSEPIDDDMIDALEVLEPDAEDLYCIYDSFTSEASDGFSDDEIDVIDAAFNKLLDMGYVKQKSKKVDSADVSIYCNRYTPSTYVVVYEHLHGDGPIIFTHQRDEVLEDLIRFSRKL